MAYEVGNEHGQLTLAGHQVNIEHASRTSISASLRLGRSSTTTLIRLLRCWMFSAACSRGRARQAARDSGPDCWRDSESVQAISIAATQSSAFRSGGAKIDKASRESAGLLSLWDVTVAGCRPRSPFPAVVNRIRP
jgi:hypothetical protein